MLLQCVVWSNLVNDASDSEHVYQISIPSFDSDLPDNERTMACEQHESLNSTDALFLVTTSPLRAPPTSQSRRRPKKRNRIEREMSLRRRIRRERRVEDEQP